MKKKAAKQEVVIVEEPKADVMPMANIKRDAVLAITFAKQDIGEEKRWSEGTFGVKVLARDAEWVIVEYRYSTRKMMGMDYNKPSERGLLMVRGEGDVVAVTTTKARNECKVGVTEATEAHKKLFA